MSLEEIELGFRDRSRAIDDLEFRAITRSDAVPLTPIFKKNALEIRKYLGTFHNAQNWSFSSAVSFIEASISAPFPSFTYVFTRGNKEIVGIGSLNGYGDPANQEVQVVLMVFGKHQGQGIASRIEGILMKISFEVWGFARVFHLVDASNAASIRVAEKNGMVLSHTWTDKQKHSISETGEWLAYVAERPEGLEDGVLQGAPISYWHETRSDQLLQAVIEARNGKRELEEEEIEEIAEEFGFNSPEEEVQEPKNPFQVALENKRAADQAALKTLTARVKRDLYNKSLAERRKKKKK